MDREKAMKEFLVFANLPCMFVIRKKLMANVKQIHPDFNRRVEIQIKDTVTAFSGSLIRVQCRKRAAQGVLNFLFEVHDKAVMLAKFSKYVNTVVWMQR